MLTQDNLIELINKYHLSNYQDLILNHSKPAIHIAREYVPDEDDLPIGASKIGGNPDLPADFEWKTYEGLPLTFLMQIKLEDVAPYDADGVLPQTGWLYFFYEMESQPWGEYEQTGGAYVHYVNDNITPLQRLPHPKKQGDYRLIDVLPAFKLSFSELWMPTKSVEFANSLAKIEPIWEDPDYLHYGDLLEEIDEKNRPLHYLLGNPYSIQGDPEIEASYGANNITYGSTDYEEVYARLKPDIATWRLLFQMDSDFDEDADFDLMFGDLGMIYFMIREQDLQTKSFEKVWTIMQCS